MGDEDNGEIAPAAKRIEEAHDRRLHGDIQRSRRFVGDDEPGLAGKRDCDRDALRHSASELVGERPQCPLGVRNLHIGQERHGAAAGRSTRHSEMLAQVFGHLRLDAQLRMKRGLWILKHHCNVTAADALKLAPRREREIAAVEDDAAFDDRVTWEQPGDGHR